MQVNRGVEHDLRRIEQIYSRLYNSEDTLGETKLDTELKLSCSQSDMQSKQKTCASIATRPHGAARAAVGYSTRSIFTELLFQQFCKRIRIYRHKFPSSTAGLH